MASLFDTIDEDSSEAKEAEIKTFKDYLKAKTKAAHQRDLETRKYSEDDSLGVAFFKSLNNFGPFKKLNNKIDNFLESKYKEPEKPKSQAQLLKEQEEAAEKLIQQKTRDQYAKRVEQNEKALAKELSSIQKLKNESYKAKKQLIAITKYNEQKKLLEAQFDIDYRLNSGQITKLQALAEHQKLLEDSDAEDNYDSLEYKSGTKSKKQKSTLESDYEDDDSVKIKEQKQEQFQDTQLENQEAQNKVSLEFVEQQKQTNTYLESIIEGLEKGNFKIITPLVPQDSGLDILPKGLKGSLGSLLNFAKKAGPIAALAMQGYGAFKGATDTEGIAEQQGKSVDDVGILDRISSGGAGIVEGVTGGLIKKESILNLGDRVQNFVTGNGWKTDNERVREMEAQANQDVADTDAWIQEQLAKRQQVSLETTQDITSQANTEGTELTPLNTTQPESSQAPSPTIVNNNSTTVVPEQPRFRIQDSTSYQLSRIGE